MNESGLLPWQPPHVQALAKSIQRFRSALDASDTGTGKTYTALALCREMGVVPFVVGPVNARISWERAANIIGTDLEYINWEKVRGKRILKGGVEVDRMAVFKNPGDLFDKPAKVFGWRNGKQVFGKLTDWYDAFQLLDEAGVKLDGYNQEEGEWNLPAPARIAQVKLTDSEWVSESKYGSGSFLKWKDPRLFGIFDEVHRAGGGKTLNSKMLIAARREFKYVLALSATAADDPRQMKALGYTLGLHELNGKQGFRPWLLRHGCNLDDETNRITLSLNTNRQSAAFQSLSKEIFPLHGARMVKSEIPNFPHSKIDVKLLPAPPKALKLAATSWVGEMQELEMLMVPEISELVEDTMGEASIAVFVSYTATREALVAHFQKKYGVNSVGWVDGSQTGPGGAAQRQQFVDRFQANTLPIIILNSQAGGESISLHDPTGQVGRVVYITPQDSGRRLLQIVGRVDRAHGANSVQYLLYFAGTSQEKTAMRVKQRTNNILLLNDADLVF